MIFYEVVRFEEDPIHGKSVVYSMSSNTIHIETTDDSKFFLTVEKVDN